MLEGEDVIAGHPAPCPSWRRGALREPTHGGRMPEVLEDTYCLVFKARSQHNLAKGERNSEGGEGLKGSQECTGKCLTTGWALNCSICPRPWCEYSHHSQFQTPSQMMTSSQNQSFRSWLSTANMSLLECPCMRPTSRVK